MIIQKELSLEEALKHICYSVCSTDMPKDFDHAEIICDFNEEDNTFTITLMDKDEVKNTN